MPHRRDGLEACRARRPGGVDEPALRRRRGAHGPRRETGKEAERPGWSSAGRIRASRTRDARNPARRSRTAFRRMRRSMSIPRRWRSRAGGEGDLQGEDSSPRPSCARSPARWRMPADLSDLCSSFIDSAVASCSPHGAAATGRPARPLRHHGAGLCFQSDPVSSGMRILVTGARGKVGSATVAALSDAGHDVTASDLAARLRGQPRPGRLHPGRPDRRGRRVRAGPRPRRGRPRGRDPRAHAEPRARRLRQQPDGDVQHARGRGALGGAALREPLERDRARLLLPRAPVASRLRPGRRGAPDPPAGSLRHRQALRRAADGRRDAPLRPHRRLDPPVLGAVGGQLRDEPRAVDARAGAVGGLLGLHRRLRPRRRDPARGRGVHAGHEVVYIASPDIASHETLETLARRFHGDAAPELRPSGEARPNGISIAKARRLLGYDPQRSWRDYLDDDGRLRPEARERLERGETGVQRGRRLTGLPGGA